VNLILSGRGVKLDDRLREYATEKFSRVERFFDRIIKMEVELRRERNPRVANGHTVEVTVKTPLQTLRAHGEGLDHFAAIDVALDKLEAQVKRVKSRLRDHSHRNGARDNGAVPFGEVVEIGEPVEVVRVQQQVTKPITADEAILELDALGMSFLLFTDAETMRAAVAYRRGDGSFGLIAHEG
jgi:ribosomal subunit interface protein